MATFDGGEGDEDVRKSCKLEGEKGDPLEESFG